MKKQGFTVVELVAVLVVLAIILAITVPIILGITESVRKNAFKSEAKIVIRSIENKKTQTVSFDERVVTKTNITSLLNISSDNYKNVTVERLGNTPYLIIVGENKWDNLVACGTNDNMKVSSGEECNILPPGPLYSDDVITSMINDGYIPVANSTELNNIRFPTSNVFGAGSMWEKEYIGGLDKKYIQIDNIDLNNFSSGEGWVPLGNSDADEPPFEGIYDGNDYKIINLFINGTRDYTGLFGRTDSISVQFKNLFLEDVDITSTGATGALVGFIYNGKSVSRVQASGNINSTGSEVGGIIGFFVNDYMIVDKCFSKVNVNGSSSVGGLVGADYSYEGSSINDSIAIGSVTAENTTAGGLIGRGTGEIRNSMATGVVDGNNDLGGLVGAFYGKKINNSRAMGDVKGLSYIGGLIGSSYGEVTNSYAIGKVDGESSLGGLIGFLGVTTSGVNKCYAKGNVKGTGEYVGGLIGQGYSDVIGSYATGSVEGSTSVGGLAGFLSSGTNGVRNCRAMGNVKGTVEYVGGLIGQSYIPIKDSYATGNIDGAKNTGGLLGFHALSSDEQLENCYSTGNVKGTIYVGGLVGQGYQNVRNCYTKGNVEGQTYVGGLFGFHSYANVENSYALGDVKGTIEKTGGLAGETYTNYSNVYSTGNVIGVNSVGGMMGYCGGYVTDSYKIGQVKGIDNVGGLFGSGTGNITGTYYEGDVVGEDKVGGFIGGNTGGNLIQRSRALGSVKGHNMIGGMIGRGGGVTILNSYAINNIVATSEYVGGLIAYMDGDSSKNSYAATSISGGTSYVGGVIGGPDRAGPASTASYWDREVSNVVVSATGVDGGGIFGKTTSEMKLKGTYEGWDFIGIWNIDPIVNNGYPYLR